MRTAAVLLSGIAGLSLTGPANAQVRSGQPVPVRSVEAAIDPDLAAEPMVQMHSAPYPAAIVVEAEGARKTVQSQAPSAFRALSAPRLADETPEPSVSMRPPPQGAFR